MAESAALVQGSALATPFGCSVGINCSALYEGRTAFRIPRHFDSKGRLLGIDPELDGGQGSRAVRLLTKLRDGLTFRIPSDTLLILATTVGAIDLLENGMETDTSAFLLSEAKKLFGLSRGILLSAACASGQTAVTLAMEQLAAGNCTHALVIGCDIASEFVTAGFSSLGACTGTICRPYDAARDGLTLGESAAALLLGHSDAGFGKIIRTAENCDAAHITAPDLEGKMLRKVIERVLNGDTPGGIIGHGTGTVYNDQAEIAALHQVFPKKSPPLFSLKGNYGHTLGATGVLQIVLGLEILRRKELPPQAGLQTPMERAAVAVRPQKITSNRLLSLNVGFGGLNSTILMRLPANEPNTPCSKSKMPSFEKKVRISLDGNEHKCTYDGKSLQFADLTDLKEQLLQMAGDMPVDLADFRRAADNVRLAQLGVLLCAIAMGEKWSPDGTGIIGINGDGCAANNRAYWDDYVAHGRDSGRASLFVPTLPSIPVCEAAIALCIKGPVRYVSSKLPIMEHLENTFAADEGLRQLITVEIDNGRAEIELYAR